MSASSLEKFSELIQKQSENFFVFCDLGQVNNHQAYDIPHVIQYLFICVQVLHHAVEDSLQQSHYFAL